MKELLLAGVLIVATWPSAQAGSLYSDEWAANCRWMIIEKLRPTGPGEDLAPESVMFITPKDLPTLEREIKVLKQCLAFWKCVDERDAGKVKHCRENDKRWRSLFKATATPKESDHD